MFQNSQIEEILLTYQKYQFMSLTIT